MIQNTAARGLTQGFTHCVASFGPTQWVSTVYYGRGCKQLWTLQTLITQVYFLVDHSVIQRGVNKKNRYICIHPPRTCQTELFATDVLM